MGRFEMRLQAVERGHGHVLGRRNDAAEEVDVAVEVAVVDGVDELAAKDAVDVLKVDDHTGVGVERTAYRDLDHVVVAVVGDARAEYLAVLLIVPVVSAQDVGRGERGAAGGGPVGGPGATRKCDTGRGADVDA